MRSLQNAPFCHSRDASGRESIVQRDEIMDARQKHSGMANHVAIAVFNIHEQPGS
jgi:hypothetical protein